MRRQPRCPLPSPPPDQLLCRACRHAVDATAAGRPPSPFLAALRRVPPAAAARPGTTAAAAAARRTIIYSGSPLDTAAMTPGAGSAGGGSALTRAGRALGDPLFLKLLLLAGQPIRSLVAWNLWAGRTVRQLAASLLRALLQLVGWLSGHVRHRRLRGFERRYFEPRRWHVALGERWPAASVGQGLQQLAQPDCAAGVVPTTAQNTLHPKQVAQPLFHLCVHPLGLQTPQVRRWPPSWCTGATGSGGRWSAARTSGDGSCCRRCGRRAASSREGEMGAGNGCRPGCRAASLR